MVSESEQGLREQVAELLAQHLALARGLGNLVSVDVAAAADSLANAYSTLASLGADDDND